MGKTPVAPVKKLPKAKPKTPRGFVNPADIAANTEYKGLDTTWSQWGDAFAGLNGARFTDGWTPEMYNSVFLTPTMNDPVMSKLITKYGPEFQAFAFEQFLTGGLDPEEMERRFPGSKAYAGYRGPGGGSGRRPQDLEDIVRNQMASLGYTEEAITAQVKDIAVRADKEDWSPEKLTQYLLRDPSQLTQPGNYTEMASRVKDMAAAQLVRLDDTTAQQWSRRILSGELDLMTVQNILAGNAVNEFGWAADALSTGATMRDILAPARDTVARELEINPNEIDLMDSKWRDMVQATNVDGTKRAATLTESIRAARKDSRWAKTSGAAQATADVTLMLRDVFGG